MPLSVDITKTYGSFRLRAAFEAGDETLALLGASGSGKSVTLRCIAGIETPDSGRIILDGRTLYDSERRINLPPQQRRVGYLFQQYALFPNMTVEQNIAAGLGERDRGRRRARIADAIAMFRLEGAEKSYPHQLSGGQQQRVALARILLSAPQAILLDEPFSALDGYLKWQLEQELFELLSSFGSTTVFVTHDAGEVRRNCARVLVLDAGRSSPVMPTGALFSRPGTVSAAMLTGCHTFAPIAPQADGSVRVPAWGVTLRIDTEAGAATMLGIRDECIRIATPTDENLLPCHVLHASADVHGGTLTLLPDHAIPGAPRIRMALPQDVWYTVKDRDAVVVSVSPADILLLT